MVVISGYAGSDSRAGFSVLGESNGAVAVYRTALPERHPHHAGGNSEVLSGRAGSQICQASRSSVSGDAVAAHSGNSVATARKLPARRLGQEPAGAGTGRDSRPRAARGSSAEAWVGS